MKKFVLFLAFVSLVFLASLSVRADVIFHDGLNYPDGSIESNGVWQVYFPAPPLAPYGDAFVTNDLLILNENNRDSVDAPFTNDTQSSIVFASFTINVTTLPSATGGFFCNFQDVSNMDEVARVFIATTGTTVPGTYRVGIDNYATSSSSAKFFPLDLATNITYHVVFSYDVNQSDTFPGATLVVNPASMTDFAASPAYGTDNAPTPGQVAITNTAIGFSQYANQGVADIGNVIVGTSFSDVFTNTPVAPVIGVEPQDSSLYSGNSAVLYTAASGLGQLTYQWLSNGVPLTDDGVTVIGSSSNILTLSNLQNTASYSVNVGNSAGATPSTPGLVSVTNTPTPPFFTKQPTGSTNGLGGSITLSAIASGTGPFTYQWFFEETNTSAFVAVGAGSSFSQDNINFAESGLYYVTVTGGDGSQNSVTVMVQVIPPPVVTIGFLHSLLFTNNVPQGPYNLNGGAIYSIKGVVTTFGSIESKTASEYFIQDATGGSLAYISGTGSTNTPPVGSVVQITGPVQEYYGGLELAPNVLNSTNGVVVLSSNSPLPAPLPLNIAAIATSNAMSPYGLAVQCSLVTITNVWLYSSATGAAVTGTYPVNATKGLYAFSKPYSAGQPYIEVFVYTYTNTMNDLNTNYWGKPLPSFAYEITGALGIFATNNPEIYPSRYQDIVTSPIASFPVGVAESNGVSTINWPAVVGSTYTLHSAPDLSGPWTQTFGLSYYPSSGTYTTTNASTNGFYYVTSP